MTTRRPRSQALAWGLLAVAVVGYVSVIAWEVAQEGRSAVGSIAGGVLAVLLFAVLGALLALRQPNNPIGWLRSWSRRWPPRCSASSAGSVSQRASSGSSCALGLSCLPLSLTVAVLRYRLYDLERVVSRTVSYAAVTGLLIATYVALVTGVSRLTPSGSSLAVAGSTLAVAALFQPLRRRVQHTVDRRFNRARFDADRTVDDFRRTLREQVDLEVVRGELLEVAQQTMQPVSAGLWLRPQELLR